jgi:hypothetical protein
MSAEPTPMRPHVTVIADTRDIDKRLPEGQLLIEHYEDGQVHVAFRAHRWHTWSKGVWTIDDTPTI